MNKTYLIIIAFFFIGSSAMAQSDSLYNKTIPSFEHHPIRAGLECLSTNIIINRYDAWARSLDWAKVNIDTWKANIHTGFQTDGDGFVNNFFGHPYHGSFFYNIARQQGASFWGAVPYVMAGSWTWEHFGETYPASEIDWNTTTLGGIYLGEVTHRLSAHLLRSDKYRDFRILRNAAALLMNPMVQINGVMYKDIYENIRDPNQRIFPVRSQFSMGIGHRFNSINEINQASNFKMNYSMIYGDFFNDDYKYQPFDFFILRMWMELSSFESSVDNYVSVMSHAPLWKLHKNKKGIFSVSSHYDFMHNSAFKIGALSLTADYHITKRNDDYKFYSAIKVGPMLFGSASSDVVEEVDLFNKDDGEFLRDYVYGQGFMLEFEIYLISERYGKFLTSYNNWTLYTQRDSPGTEQNSIFKIEYYYPIWNNVGLGVEYFYYRRNANYEELIDYQNVVDGYSELKFSTFISF